MKDEFTTSIKDEVYEFIILASKQHDDKRNSVIIQFPEKLAKEFGYSLQEDSPSAMSPYALLIQRHETSTIPHYIDMDKFSRENFDKTLLSMH